MTELRPYQQSLIDALRRSFMTGHRRPLVQSPTGSGKTLVMAQLTANAVGKNRHVLVLAPRRELIHQTSEKLAAMDVRHGVVMAGEPPSLSQRVQVACVPTLHKRAIQGERMMMLRADLVIVDEAHLSIARTTQELLWSYPDATIVGFTATPARTDGRPLGEVYDDLILGPTVSDLTKSGYLVPVRYYSGSRPALDDVTVRGGDYAPGELAAVANEVTLIGDVVTNWLRLASDRKTVVFCVDVAHSRHMCQRFLDAGIAAEQIDGDTEKPERAAVLKRLRDGQTQVVTNCDVLTYGWDEPSISCAVMARPTKSIVRYLQMAGRVLRPFYDKEDCLILDHSGVVTSLGFVDDPMPWTLSGKGKIQDAKKAERKDPEPIICGDCGTTFKPAPQCPECGAEQGQKYERAIVTTDDELTELDRARKRRNREWTPAEKRQFWGEIQGLIEEKGKKPGFAAHLYREKFSVWPNAHRDQGAITPSPETRSWYQSAMIRRAKRREAA